MCSLEGGAPSAHRLFARPELSQPARLCAKVATNYYHHHKGAHAPVQLAQPPDSLCSAAPSPGPPFTFLLARLCPRRTPPVEDLVMWHSIPKSAAVLGGTTLVYLLLEVRLDRGGVAAWCPPGGTAQLQHSLARKTGRHAAACIACCLPQPSNQMAHGCLSLNTRTLIAPVCPQWSKTPLLTMLANVALLATLAALVWALVTRALNM